MPVSSRKADGTTPGRIVLVLQGGGALGAYQAGVYHALHEAGLEPDWVIGTSIGAINAGLIAGNAPQERVARLRAFWRAVEYSVPASLMAALPGGGQIARMMTMATGVAGFFTPYWQALLGDAWPLGAELAGHYSVAPLRATLAGLIDFERINRGETRISVGAANVCTSEMRYFDSRDEVFTIDHVLASGALPPAFPAIRIDGALYWDGGILSNTPLEAIFDDNPRRDALIFAVHVWNAEGKEPATMGEVLSRQKDVQYASRSRSHVARQKQIHKLRHVVAELARLIPQGERDSAAVRELASYGCLTRMHVVRLQALAMDGEDHMRDIDFSAAGIRARWEAGYRDAGRAIERAPWTAPCDPMEGVLLHEVPSPETAAADRAVMRPARPARPARPDRPEQAGRRRPR